MMPKMHTETLQSAGLKILASHNLKLVHDATKRGKIFRTQDGRSVRVRTNIKRSIPCKSQDTNLRRGTLDIEGTEFICLIVPKSAGNAAEVEVYFMPTSIAVREVKEAHIKWLEYGKSKGTNFTPALCLDRVPSGKEKNLNDLWSEYRFE